MQRPKEAERQKEKVEEAQNGQAQEAANGRIEEVQELRTDVSGLYTWRAQSPSTRREQLRLDVDRNYPQMVASGTYIPDIFTWAHWIADLSASGPNSWTGSIWYTDTSPGRTFPYTSVR